MKVLFHIILLIFLIDWEIMSQPLEMLRGWLSVVATEKEKKFFDEKKMSKNAEFADFCHPTTFFQDHSTLLHLSSDLGGKTLRHINIYFFNTHVYKSDVNEQMDKWINC